MTDDLPEHRKAFLARDFCRGFIDYCGFQGEPLGRGAFRSQVEITGHHRQQDGFIHAGVMAAMADHTAGYAAFTTVDEHVQILTIEFKINFLRPAYGDLLVCRSQVIRQGRRIIIAESEVLDRQGAEEIMVAKALVTMMPVPEEKLKAAR